MARGRHRRRAGLPWNGNGFRKRADAVIKGEGNLGWSLVALGRGLFAAGAYSGSSDKVSLSGTVRVYGDGGAPQKMATLEGNDAMDRFGYALAQGIWTMTGTPTALLVPPALTRSCLPSRQQN